MITIEVDEIKKEQPVYKEDISKEEMERISALFPEEYICLYNSDPLIPFL